jgi:serine/threonine protein kinase
VDELESPEVLACSPALSSWAYREYRNRITAGVPGLGRRDPVLSPPDISTLYINPDEYEVLSPTRSGAYGAVSKAVHKPTGLVVAMKKLFRADPEHYGREVENAASFVHSAILPVIGCTPFCSQPIIITPFMAGGSVQSIISAMNEDAKGDPPDWWTFTAKLIILFGVAAGVGTLHERRVMHRDLKPDNVLLDGNHEPKIGDFGCSKIAQVGATQNNTADGIGTPGYAAPEVLNGEPYDFPADVFAFGITMYAVLAGRDPFPGLSPFVINRTVVDGGRPEFPDDTPAALVRLAQRCWDGDQTRRPRIQEVIADLESPEVLACSSALASWAYREYRDRILGRCSVHGTRS